MNRRYFLKSSSSFLAAGAVLPQQLLKNGLATTAFQIEQFTDSGLAQFSYALLFDKKIILIDPARDPQPFYDFAANHQAKITGVIETHPHADFISSHAEIHRYSGAKIYASKKLNAQYPHHALEEGDTIALNEKLQLKILETPGHSPDSISVLLREQGEDRVIFTGDALLFGDVGRPDLREQGNNENEQRTYLAKAMYHTVNKKYKPLQDPIIVYPAHGAGSLCGNTIRNVTSSTIGYEKKHNHAFRHPTETAFVAALLRDLPFIPKYFPYDVALNRSGAPDVKESTGKVPLLPDNYTVPGNAFVVDIRPASLYQKSYYPGAVIIPEGNKFETWLGTVVAPSQKFFLVVPDSNAFTTAVHKLAKIGYETNIEGGFVYTAGKPYPATLNEKEFISGDKKKYTIIDVRNAKEYEDEKILADAVNIPLPELEKRFSEIAADRPVVVHCASGYRSAIATSMLRKRFPQLDILDLGASVIALKNQRPPEPDRK